MGVPVAIDTVKDLSKAARDMILRQYVDEDTASARMDICRICPHLHGKRCGVCGCHMDKKIILRSSKCPLDKWSSRSEFPIDDTNHHEGDE
jgi:hypothetical protein